VVITTGDTGQAVESIQRVLPHGPDLIELRLDYMEDPVDLAAIRDATVLPLIATDRSGDQGGRGNRSEEDRLGTLMEACDAGFDFVDIETTTLDIEDAVTEAKAKGVGVIVSFHDFDGTPQRERLDEIMRRELRQGADICKIVGTSNSPGDCLTYLAFLDENRDTKLVSFGMGSAGSMSRVFSPLFGGEFTYASAGIGEESAPGQLTISDLRGVYRVLGV
jgi:3-dehydroquinate dehydratase type I